MKLYSIRDKAVEAFNQPFYARADGHALRMFIDAINDPKGDFHRHAEDYDLWMIGSFDDAAGVVSCPDDGPVRIMAGTSALQMVQERGSASS